MNNKDFWNKALPHILIILGFLFVAFIYTSPVLQNKRLSQNDIIQAQSAAKPLKEHHEKTGKLSFWADNMFSGMPAYMVYTDYPNSITSRIGRFITYILPSPTNLIFLSFIGFYFLMIVLRYDPYISAVGAIAFTFASYNIINIDAGHFSKVLAIALSPPILASVILTFRGKYLLGGALTALFTGIQLYANHVQITYYIFLALGIYAIFELVNAIREKKIKQFGIASGILILAGILAIGSHYSRIITTYEYSKASIRGKSDLQSNKQSKGGLDRDYAFDWSYGKLETLTAIIPNLYGGGSGDSQVLDEKSSAFKSLSASIGDQGAIALTQYLSGSLYWGKQPFTAGPAYFGAIVVFLFVFSFLISKHWIKWWLLSVTIFFIILSWGKNLAFFNYFMFDYFPLYNKFRAVTMLLAVVQIFVVWMMMLGLKELFASEFNKEFIQKRLFISLGVVGGLVFFLTFLGGTVLKYKTDTIKKLNGQELADFNKDEQTKQGLIQYLTNPSVDRNQTIAIANDAMKALKKDRASKQFYDGLRSLIYIVLAGGVIWLFLNNTGFQKMYLAGALAVLIMADMIGVSWRYLNNDKYVKKSEYNDNFEPTKADLAIQKNKGIYRVLNLTKSTFADATTSAQHKSLGGYHGAKMRRYQELYDAHFSQNINNIYSVANMSNFTLMKNDTVNLSVFNMLNTKHIIVPLQNQQLAIFENPQALGNAWFVEDYKIAENADKALSSLGGKFEAGKTAIIEKSFTDKVKGFKPKSASGSIKIKSYQPDKIVYESQADGERLAVFSEIYYVNQGKSEWKVKIDGKPVEHFRANYILRAMRIPKGKHTITFEFEAPVYHSGETMALIFSILMFLFLGFAAFMEYKNTPKVEAKA